MDAWAEEVGARAVAEQMAFDALEAEEAERAALDRECRMQAARDLAELERAAR